MREMEKSEFKIKKNKTTKQIEEIHKRVEKQKNLMQKNL